MEQCLGGGTNRSAKAIFTKLDKKLKGEDRFHLMAIKTKIDELENGLQTFDLGTDENGKIFKRISI